jgi:hypothetical protein
MKYVSTQEMVDNLSSKQFAKAFREELAKRTVYVYVDSENNLVQVFKNLKDVKAHLRQENWGKISPDHWQVNKTINIYRRKILG